MKRASIALLTGLLVVLLVSPAALAVAQSDGQQTAQANETATDYTIQELRTDGTHYKKPTARIAGRHVYWLTHKPAEQPWENEKQILEDETVRANELWLNSIRVDPEPTTKRVKIVFWTVGTQTVTEGNTTTTKQVPQNVSTISRTVTLGKGWPSAKLDLPRHDQPVYMTIWIEGLSSEARWTLKHESIATTQAAGIDSEGDYLFRAAYQFILPTLIGTFGVGWRVKSWMDNGAGAGPQWGYLPWIILLTIIMGIAVFGFFGSLADVFVNLPYIISLWTVGVIGIVILETYSTDVMTAEFFQPRPQAARSASGDHALDARKARRTTEKVVRDSKGLKVIRGGLLPFWSRRHGGAAKLEGVEELDTEIELVDSDADLFFVVSPNAEDVIDYKPEGWEFATPTSWGAIGVMGLALLAGAAIAYQMFGMVPALVVGTVALAKILATPTDGYARIDPAPGHLRSAWVTSLFMTKEADEAETLQESRSKRVEEMAKNQKDVEQALEDRDATLIQEMHGLQNGQEQATNGRHTPEIEEGDKRDPAEVSDEDEQ